MTRKRHPSNRRVSLLGILALAVVLAACSSVAPSAGGSVNSVAIDQGDSTMQVGDTLALTATVDVSGGAADTVDWSSSDTAVATVDAGGTVSAVSGGTSTITATSTADSTQSDSITVTVASPTATPSDIYVDASAAAGGNGSSATPFQTIAAGVSAVDAGGTVHVAAGTYDEALRFTKALDLVGAGAGSTTITTTAGANGTGDAIAVASVDGLSLSGFTLDVHAPGPSSAAVGVYGGSSNFMLKDVTISQSDSNQDAGIVLTGVTGATIDNVTVTDTSGTAGSAGVLVTGGSSGVTLSNLTVNGHANYAGIVLDPGAGTLSDITITGATLNQKNKMEMDISGGGTVTGLNAPQFTDVVRNAAAYYGAGDWLFYKMNESEALVDSLFNFGSDPSQSYIQQLDGTDQAKLLESYVVGAADGAPYNQSGVVRTSSIQTAIDHAAAGATIHVRDSLGSSYDEALTVNVAGLSIAGAGGASRVTAPTGGPVIDVTANNVTITGVNLDTSDTGNAAVQLDSSVVSGLVVHGSNFLSAIGLEDTATASANSVDATGNYWNATDGPSGAGQSGSGAEIIDRGGNVDASSFATTAF